MTNEDFKELSKWVVLNNKLLQTLLVLQVGEEPATKIIKEFIKLTEIDFEKLKKEGKKDERNN